MSEGASRFSSMEIHEADRECGKPRRLHHRDCPRCEWRVVLHCDQCLIQVSGCLCTMVERHGQDGALDILQSEKFGDSPAGAEARLRAAGLWVPH